MLHEKKIKYGSIYDDIKIPMTMLLNAKNCQKRNLLICLYCWRYQIFNIKYWLHTAEPDYIKKVREKKGSVLYKKAATSRLDILVRKIYIAWNQSVAWSTWGAQWMCAAGGRRQKKLAWIKIHRIQACINTFKMGAQLSQILETWATSPGPLWITLTQQRGSWSLLDLREVLSVDVENVWGWKAQKTSGFADLGPSMVPVGSTLETKLKPGPEWILSEIEYV